MLTVQALLAAMTIAGAFWVGVLAARRLRDWGEGRRAIDDGGGGTLALAASSSAPPDDPRTRKVRELVAKRLHGSRYRDLETAPRPIVSDTGQLRDELGFATLRSGDVIVVESGDAAIDGDYIVEGLVLLREGGVTTVVAVAADGNTRRWIIGSEASETAMIVEPVNGHGLVDEPPRNLLRERGSYGLSRRGQASAAGSGRHGRPDLPRAATYVYTGTGRHVLWLERWDHDVLMGEGHLVDAHNVSFLPGS